MLACHMIYKKEDVALKLTTISHRTDFNNAHIFFFTHYFVPTQIFDNRRIVFFSYFKFSVTIKKLENMEIEKNNGYWHKLYECYHNFCRILYKLYDMSLFCHVSIEIEY